jgi:hypothetical protein
MRFCGAQKTHCKNRTPKPFQQETALKHNLQSEGKRDLARAGSKFF